jgi:hypothetical protein
MMRANGERRQLVINAPLASKQDKSKAFFFLNFANNVERITKKTTRLPYCGGSLLFSPSLSLLDPAANYFQKIGKCSDKHEATSPAIYNTNEIAASFSSATRFF